MAQDPGGGQRVPAQQLLGSVGPAVVHDDRLPPGVLQPLRGERVEQAPEQPRPVVRGDHHRDVGIGHHSPVPAPDPTTARMDADMAAAVAPTTSAIGVVA